jgi:putative holliday junction resolvase
VTTPVTGLRRGVRLGIDVGSVRIGVAACDPDGLLVSPVETIRRDQGGRRPSGAGLSSDLARIVELVRESQVVEIVVGLPLSLSGGRGAAADAALAYARELAAAVSPVPVRLVDERLSTVSAHSQLRTAGLRSLARREVVDQAAAVIILQSALDAERASGRAPGELLSGPGGGA